MAKRDNTDIVLAVGMLVATLVAVLVVKLVIG